MLQTQRCYYRQNFDLDGMPACLKNNPKTFVCDSRQPIIGKPSIVKKVELYWVVTMNCVCFQLVSVCQNSLCATVAKHARTGFTNYLNPKRNWFKVWDCKKGTWQQAISLLKQNENSEWHVNHTTSHSDRDSEWESLTAKRASCLQAFHHMTLSRSRLLILSDLSLKSCSRVVTVKNSQGSKTEPL